MTLVDEYLDARRGEDVARMRRSVALRAMLATGMSQREVADELGVSQSAVSQQLRSTPDPAEADPAMVLQAAAPVLKALARERGFSRLAVFGSVARQESSPGSDIDLLVKAPKGTSSFDLVRFQQLVEKVLGHRVDVVEYGGLKAGIDDDIRREAVLL
ncbi:MAG: nucleotidyltransferase family protein [Candidatus Nanopelagicales bacterium]